MHYVCQGSCGGVATQPGTCSTQDCPNFQKPLQACECDDATHGSGTPAPQAS